MRRFIFTIVLAVATPAVAQAAGAMQTSPVVQKLAEPKPGPSEADSAKVKAVNEAREYLGTVSGAILFNCVLRYLEMKEEKKLDAFHKVFSEIPYVGFNTYGEELFTHHNQTLTALFLGE